MKAQAVYSEPQRDRLRRFACLRGISFLALLQTQRQWLIERQRDDGAVALDNCYIQPIQPKLSRRLVELAGLLYEQI